MSQDLFLDLAINEDIDNDMAQEVWKRLYPHETEVLDEDIVRIAIRSFQIGQGAIQHVCGLQGFGAEVWDICDICTKYDEVNHLHSYILRFIHSKDFSLVGDTPRIERYKKHYGLD